MAQKVSKAVESYYSATSVTMAIQVVILTTTCYLYVEIYAENTSCL